MSSQNQNEEEKIWERPWDSSDMINNSAQWSLAGDAGLLLKLKQFTENLTSKAVQVEKELQKLAFEEKRVYEEAIENIIKEKSLPEKQEKTKEEKEQELYSTVYESIKIGMSIMDNYFDKLNSNQQSNDSDSEEEDEEDDDKMNNTNLNEDIIIYETKDPYVLRSLPYIIGSTLYLDNDHVGLKDLDEEEEEEIQDDEQNIEDEDDSETESETQEESNKFSELSSESVSESENEKEIKSKQKEKKKKQENLFDNSEDDDQEDNLFGSTNRKASKKNLFDDDEDDNKSQSYDIEDGDDDDDDDKSVKQTEKNFEPQEKELEEEKPKINKQLDFASELSMRLASKTKQKENKEPENKSTKINQEEEKFEEKTILTDKLDSKQKKSIANSLFDNDNDDDEEENNLFSSNSKKTVSSTQKSRKSLFDADSDSDKEQNIFTKTETKTEVKKEENKLANELNKVLKNKILANDESESNSDDEFENEFKTTPEPAKFEVQTSNFLDNKKNKLSLFDDDEEDDEKEDIVDFLSKKPIPITKSLPEPPVTSSMQKKISTLFDDEEEVEDLFNKTLPVKKADSEKNHIPAPEPPVKTKIVLKPKEEEKPKKSILFDDSDSDDALFKSNTTKSKPVNEENKNNLNVTKIEKEEQNLVIKQEDENLSEQKTKFNETIKPNLVESTNRNDKPKKSLFSGLSDDDDDLFKSASKEKIIEKEHEKEIEKDKEIQVESSKPVKKLGKNVLFDPLGLKSNNLFKKIAQVNKSEDESDKEEIIEQTKQLIENKKIENVLADPFSTFMNVSKTPLNKEQIDKVKNTQESLEENFDNFKLDSSIHSSGFNNAQKDRIKAANKRRAPTQQKRRPTEETNDINLVLEKQGKLELDFGINKSINEKELFKSEKSEIKNNSQEVDKKEKLLINENILNEKAKKTNILFPEFGNEDDDIFKIDLKSKEEKKQKNINVKIEENTKQEKKTLKNLFSNLDDLDDDIFNIKPKSETIKKVDSQKNKEEESNKKNSNKEEIGKKSSLFQDLDDDEDIFASMPKKNKSINKKKDLDSIFDDPLNLND